jgi:hypothetical protein
MAVRFTAVHFTRVEYRFLNPKPYKTTCSACDWGKEYLLLKPAQKACKAHEEKMNTAV